MPDQGLYGDRLVKFLPMIKQAPPQILKSLRRGTFAAMRIACFGPLGEPTPPSPPDEAVAMALRLRLFRADLFVNGRAVPYRGATDEVSVIDLRNEFVIHFHDHFDTLYLYFSHSALIELANEHGASRAQYDIGPILETFDPVVSGLGQSLLPALEAPREANELFVGYVAMALGTHFLRTYTRLLPGKHSERSGLAPWQLRTAKSLIRTHLDGELSLARIAGECGLSAPHFARAFKASTGSPPHRWLMQQRIAESKRLLTETTLSLTEIAIKCGFADQSHFTRAFSAAIGAPPRRWRVARKS